MSTPVRWGILGTANIAKKNWRALQLAGNATLSAVASRNPDRARAFVDACQSHAPFPTRPRVAASYEDLLADSTIEAVYIPLPTGPRKDWILRAARAGKHIVGEKPCAASVADLNEILAACRDHGVQFMDGVMFVHSLRFTRLLECLRAPDTVGPLRRVTSQFSFLADPDFADTNIRGDARLEPQGCLGDLGWYNILFTLLAFGGALPRAVTGRLLRELPAPAGNPGPGVPAEFAAEMLYDEGRSGSFYCSFTAGDQQWAIVSGTLGTLRVDDFVLPFDNRELGFEILQPTYEMTGCDFRMLPRGRRVTVAESSHGAPDAQEASLFRNFSAQIRSGRLNPQWPDWALKTQIVLDACLASANAGGKEVPVEMKTKEGSQTA